MGAGRVIVGIAAGALVALGTVVAPAFGASEHTVAKTPKRSTLRSVGGFTPASGDPRLAALLARGGFDSNGFHFTPADTRRDTRAVTVAVRARSIRAAESGRTSVASNTTAVGLAPIAYNLGAAVGWKRFALAGDVTRVDMQGLPGGREGADVAVSYTGNRWTGQVKAAADRPVEGTPHAIADMPSYSVDLGGSYSLTHNLDVTAGLRYRWDRERLTRAEERRDSQAVYVGTAFRF